MKSKPFRLAWGLLGLPGLATSFAQVTSTAPASLPASLPELPWHLTARPWKPVDAPKAVLLDQMEKAVRAMVPMQVWDTQNPNAEKNGAIIDPIDHKEIQYGTPLFAFNVAVLHREGRAEDLLPQAARALDRSTRDISDGPANDWHGEFFCAAMVKALRIFAPLEGKHPEFSAERMKTWRERMKSPRERFMNMKVKQNWRTFAMKGEWLRHQDGYISDGVRWNEANWTEASEGGQRERFRRDLDKYGMKPHFFLYHDDTADPETFAYNGATTANLLDMLESGYDGASAKEMREIISRNLRASLLMLSGSGEAPGGGRTGEHIWDDSIYANTFALMAEAALREGDTRLAGQYHRAVELLQQSHARFQQENGWFSITKNRFPASLKNRYASWSGIANYLGFTLACCSETVLARKHEIAEQAVPSEIGGYAMTLDPSFANVFVNAGGMQVQLCNRGETDKYGGVQWHALGITRFSRSGWDGRLGPGAGHVNADFSDGLSFSPCFMEDGKWKRVCLDPKRFEGSFKADFVHPLLVRGTYTIAPVAGKEGPSFAMHLTLTPDGVLVDTERTGGSHEFGVICPLLEFDGRTVLEAKVGERIASTAYPRAAGDLTSHQAEKAELSGGTTVATDRPDFRGDGLVRFSAEGGAVEWTGLDGGEGGATTIGFRYSLGLDPQGTRRGTLVVNGKPTRELVFPSTGGRNFWHELHVPEVLASGSNNVVRLEFKDEGVALDELRLYPVSPQSPEPDQQNFIALGEAHRLDSSDASVRGGYGDFRPVRVTGPAGGKVEIFVYPRSAGDPQAEQVRASFRREGSDFSSALGWVKGSLYAGRSSAGGVGKSIDLDRDGKDDVSFSDSCAFVLQLKQGHVTAVETDREVTATIGKKELRLEAHAPVELPDKR